MLTKDTKDPIVSTTREVKMDDERATFEQFERKRFESGEMELIGAFGDLDFGLVAPAIANVPSVLPPVKKEVAAEIEQVVAVQVNVKTDDEDSYDMDDIDADEPPALETEVWNRPYSRDALDRMCDASLTYDEKDLGNAQRFAILFRGKFRFMHALKSWYFYNGKVWVQCKNGQAETAMRETILAIKDELKLARQRAKGTTEKSRQRSHVEKLGKHFSASSTSEKIKSALSVASMENSMKVDRLDMDGERSDYLFNAFNGTIDLRTGVLREFDPADLIARTSPIVLADDSNCRVFKTLLNTVFLGDSEVIHYMMKIIGGAMIGAKKATQEFYMLQGKSGSNGKSTIFQCAMDIFGSYGVTSDAATWTGSSKKSGASHSTDLVRLDNARLIFVPEVEKDVQFNEAVIKPWSGGDKMIARDLGVQSIELRSNGTLLLSSNHRQLIKASDTSMWRRNKSIPFNAKFTNASHDKVGVDGFTHVGDDTVPEKLRAEYPQIFRFFVEYCVLYQKEGLRDVPQAVQSAIQAHRDSSDAVLEFVKECCARSGEHESKSDYTETTQLWKAYATWAKEDTGRSAFGRKNFVEEMARLGFKEGEPSRYSNRRVIEGVVITRNDLIFTK